MKQVRIGLMLAMLTLACEEHATFDLRSDDTVEMYQAAIDALRQEAEVLDSGPIVFTDKIYPYGYQRVRPVPMEDDVLAALVHQNPGSRVCNGDRSCWPRFEREPPEMSVEFYPIHRTAPATRTVGLTIGNLVPTSGSDEFYMTEFTLTLARQGGTWHVTDIEGTSLDVEYMPRRP